MIKSIREYGLRRYGLYLGRKHWRNSFSVWIAMIIFGVVGVVLFY